MRALRAFAGGDAASEDALEIVDAHQHFSRAASLGRPDDPLLLEMVDEAGGPHVPDPHLPLQQRYGAVARPDDEAGGVGKQAVVVLALLCLGLLPRLQQFLDVFRLPLSAPKLHEALALGVADERPLDPHGPDGAD